MNDSDNLKDKAENTSNAWQKVVQIVFDSIPKYYEIDVDGAVVKDANGNLVKKIDMTLDRWEAEDLQESAEKE